MAAKKSEPKTTVDMVNEAIDQADMSAPEPAPAPTDELTNKMQAYSEKLSADVERYVSEGIETIQKIATEYSTKVSESATQASEQARRALDEGKAYVREYPATTVLGAFAVGVLLGALIRRR